MLFSFDIFFKNFHFSLVYQRFAGNLMSMLFSFDTGQIFEKKIGKINNLQNR
jgi:hypothetical protein